MTNISLFDYHLPENLIAQRPTEKRDGSRLLTLDKKSGAITHKMFADLPSLLRSGDLLVINDTKVIPARLLGKRSTGGAVEILLSRHFGGGEYEAMVKPLAKLKPCEKIVVGDSAVTFVKRAENGLAHVEFNSEEDANRLLKDFGDTPLPPYIHRPDGHADFSDIKRYQTIFADKAGSCAAPTAGLHFTDEIFRQLEQAGVETVSITLHVGPGTFRPVKADQIEDHVMDAEIFNITSGVADAVNSAKGEGRRIIAVGSTATRALESAVDENGNVQATTGETRLYITPDRTFNVIDGMITNFHLPKSSLMILVSAFAGRENIMTAYQEAVSEKYRFFSYGDAMLIL